MKNDKIPKKGDIYFGLNSKTYYLVVKTSYEDKTYAVDVFNVGRSYQKNDRSFGQIHRFTSTVSLLDCIGDTALKKLNNPYDKKKENK